MLSLESATQCVTIVGGPIALFAASFAWWQYSKNVAARRLSHVNGLFRDLLRLEFDFFNAPNPDPAARIEVKKRLNSYKMWVLEEMWIWLDDLKNRVPWLGEAKLKHARLIKNWNTTLEFHLQRVDAEAWPEFVEWKGCYHHGFYDYVKGHMLSVGTDIEEKKPANRRQRSGNAGKKVV